MDQSKRFLLLSDEIQHISLLNAQGEVLKSEYVQTDGVDSTLFALSQGKGAEVVRIQVMRMDTVYSETEYTEKIQGTGVLATLEL